MSCIRFNILIGFLLYSIVYAQGQNDTTNINEKKIKKILLDEIILDGTDKKTYSVFEYFMLKQRVLKVYPYVDSISEIVKLVEYEVNFFKNKRQKRKYIKKTQKKITSQFRKNIMDLTRKEGVILCKLIYREFGVSSYDLINKYRGRGHAFWWQTLSRIYDGDLKSVFNPDIIQEDMLIEYILDEQFSNK